MHISLLALGSRGDVQPFVPLGRGLQAAGHQVRIISFETFAPLIAAAGLDFHPVRGDAEALVRQAGEQLLGGRVNPFGSFGALRRSYGALTHQIEDALAQAVRAPTDLILNQLPGDLYGLDWAERFNVPHAQLAVIPLARSRTFANMAFPAGLGWLPGYNTLTHRVAEQLVWVLYGASVQRWRRRLGLRPAPVFGSFDTAYRQRVPLLNGFSEQVVSRPPDWGRHVHLTGWWLPDDPEWQPAPELLRFLDGGPPLVFIGFGSMPVREPARLTRLICEAVEISGKRALLLAGWAGLGGGLPGQVFSLTYAPYSWLFERVGGIVHHGGSGTTGFALRSGNPSLVVPFGFDQFFWGRRTAELGVGPPPLPISALTPDRLARALEQLEAPELRAGAQKLRRALRAEDGVGRAVAILGGLA